MTYEQLKRGDAVWLPGLIYKQYNSSYVDFMVILLEDFIVGVGAPILAFPPNGVAPSDRDIRYGRNENWGANYKAKTVIQYKVFKRTVR